MATLTPLTAIDPRRLAALMRLSARARKKARAALSDSYTAWWQHQRELVFSCPASGQELFNKLATWIERAGEPVYAGQEHLAKLCGCHVRTVTRNLRHLKAVGLIEQRRRRWQDKRGRWHEASSLYSLPPPPPDAEQEVAGLRGLLRAAELALAHRIDKTGVQTLPKARQTQNKVASGPRLGRKQDPNGDWKRPGPILTRMLALGTIRMQE